MNEKRERIVSIQALRALAFLGIFLLHAGTKTFNWASLGVSIFFVLSGYLLIFQYSDRDIGCSLKSNLMFSWCKIKKLYPLHIITMSLVVFLNIVLMIKNGTTIRNIIYLIGCTGLNVTLLQTWVPNSPVNVSLNGVAWYLSVTLFLYFIFPVLKLWLQDKEKKLLIWISVGILVLEIILCIPFIICLGKESPVYIWFSYCFPVFRIGDFFIGCCLGKINLECEKGQNNSFLTYSIYEILALILTIIVYWLIRQEITNPLLVATQNNTTVYIPLAVIWVELFVKKSGILTRILTNRVTVFIGNISAYTFLIHYIIILYLSQVISFFNIELSYLENIIKIIIELFLTIIVSVIYMKLSNKISKKNV